jgi:hypothetical protein
MRLVSPVALGLMLAVAGGSAVVPAVAKEKAEKPAKAEYSPAFIKEAQAIQKLDQAKDYAGVKAALETAAAAASTPDDKMLLGQFRLNAGTGLSDPALQRQGLNEMLASGRVAAADQARFSFFAGKLAFDAKDYDGAIPYLQKASDAGFEGSTGSLLLAETYFQKAIVASGGTGQLNAASKPVAAQGLPYLKKAVEAEKAAGKPVPASWYDRGFSIAYLTGSPDAAEWSKANLAADPSGKNWRNLLLTFQNQNTNLSRGENLDLLRLMRKTGALEPAGYGEYVDLATKSGLIGEVKAVIDEGRASGKLQKTQLQDYYQPAVEGAAKDKASLASSEASAAKAPTGKPVAVTADALLGYGEYAKAIALYKTALQKGSVDANEINTRIGIALGLSGDTAGAKSAFESVTGGARKSIAEYWLLWLSTKQAA